MTPATTHPPLRISFVLPPLAMAGGIRVILTHARHLQARGHSVQLVTQPRPRPSLSQRLKRSLRLQSPEAPLSLATQGLQITTLTQARPVCDADLPDADVVVATYWRTVPWVMSLSPSKGAKVFFAQGYEIKRGRDPQALRSAWAAPMQRIVVSRWLQQIAREQFGDPDAALVPNSVDTQLFNAPPRGKQPCLTVGLACSHDPAKGTDIAAQAMAIARGLSAGPIRMVAFALKQPEHEQLRPPLTELHLSPPQERLRELYASCDAWLFPSLAEGFGLPLLEAMACRTPVIATPAGAAPELVTSRTGWMVRPSDPADLASAILRLQHLGEAPWRAMSDAAHQLAHRYTWTDASELFELALREAIRKTRRMQAHKSRAVETPAVIDQPRKPAPSDVSS